MGWPAIIGTILRYALPIVLTIFTGWFLFSAGGSVLQGIQQAAPGLGAMFGSIGMMFSMFPMFMMMFMMMSMMTMIIKAFI